MKIYLAGPMTGKPDFNYPAFHAMAWRLRAMGYDVVNPAENFGGDQSLKYEIYMRAALKSVLTCDAVAVLPGWQESRGATREAAVADWCGIPVLNAERLALGEEAERDKRNGDECEEFTRLHLPISIGVSLVAIAVILFMVFVLHGCAMTERGAARELRKTFQGL